MIYTDSCPIYCTVCEIEYTYNPKKFLVVHTGGKTYHVCMKCVRECVSSKIKSLLANTTSTTGKT